MVYLTIRKAALLNSLLNASIILHLVDTLFSPRRAPIIKPQIRASRGRT